MGIEGKPYREGYEGLLSKQQEEKEGFIDRAHEQAIKDNRRLSELLLLEEKVSLEQAKEIMDKDFLGPEAVKNVFGVELDLIPPIPFTKEDLEIAKTLNQQLVLQTDEMEDGKPITLKNMKDKFPTARDGEKMWYSQDWYNQEYLFKNETPKAGWKLVSKDIIPGSTSQNYYEQTETIIKYLKEYVFKDKPIPEIYQNAINEFESQKSDIAKLIINIDNWQSAAVDLANLQITKLTRENPAEVMYRLILQDKENKEKLLSSRGTWTRRCDSGGWFVLVGDFNSGGVRVDGRFHGYRRSDIGVSFSRSL